MSGLVVAGDSPSIHDQFQASPAIMPASNQWGTVLTYIPRVSSTSFRNSELVNVLTVNCTGLRPDTWIVNGFGDDAYQVLYASKRQIHVPFRGDHYASVLNAPKDLKHFYVLRCLLRYTQIIHRAARLEQRVLHDLDLAIRKAVGGL